MPKVELEKAITTNAEVNQISSQQEIAHTAALPV